MGPILLQDLSDLLNLIVRQAKLLRDIQAKNSSRTHHLKRDLAVAGELLGIEDVFQLLVNFFRSHLSAVRTTLTGAALTTSGATSLGSTKALST